MCEQNTPSRETSLDDALWLRDVRGRILQHNVGELIRHAIATWFVTIALLLVTGFAVALREL